MLRDDFDASSLNTGEWDYEISMYGGYVSVVNFILNLSNLSVL